MFVLMGFQLNLFLSVKSAVEDFLLHDFYELAAFAEQQKNAVRLKEVSSYLPLLVNFLG